MLPVPLRESSSAAMFRAELKDACYHLIVPHHNGVGSSALSCTLCSYSMLLGTMSPRQTPRLVSESSCLFRLIININSIFPVNSVHAK